jgi:hypothetical protein
MDPEERKKLAESLRSAAGQLNDLLQRVEK